MLPDDSEDHETDHEPAEKITRRNAVVSSHLNPAPIPESIRRERINQQIYRHHPNSGDDHFRRFGQLEWEQHLLDVSKEDHPAARRAGWAGASRCKHTGRIESRN